MLRVFILLVGIFSITTIVEYSVVLRHLQNICSLIQLNPIVSLLANYLSERCHKFYFIIGNLLQKSYQQNSATSLRNQVHGPQYFLSYLFMSRDNLHYWKLITDWIIWWNWFSYTGRETGIWQILVEKQSWLFGWWQ